MEDVKGSTKRKQTDSFGPNMPTLINFFYRYTSYLLPALLKIGAVKSCHGHRRREIEKVVRFEVDMALVVSASGFAWSRALKRKLEEGTNEKWIQYSRPSKPLSISFLFSSSEEDQSATRVAEALDELFKLSLSSRRLAPFSSQVTEKPNSVPWNVRRKVGRGDEELHHRVKNLRRILPGGEEMGVSQLLSEVESYVICLELQVKKPVCKLCYIDAFSAAAKVMVR
ncbi:hypothetical protein Taro_041108 [Colocasia esculenta]|uniref:IBH1-like N-terminal domain-containing protein n=1 Tax=Colocasia esculenta TaxID=4460 RepID=A0A843WAM8_COLES|nr:hypothetical protein [Colocasia esculenta]